MSVYYGAADTVAFVVGDVLGDALVRPGGVVIRLVSGQDGMQMSLPDDQHTVQEVAAQDAGQAFADRVHARRLHSGAQDPGTGGLEDGAERGGEVPDPRSRIRNLLRHEVARCE